MLGSSLATTRDVVDGARAVTGVVSTGLTHGEALLVDGVGVGVVDGRLDLEPLVSASAEAGNLPVAPLQEARDRLAAPAQGWVPARLRAARLEVLETAETTLDAGHPRSGAHRSAARLPRAPTVHAATSSACRRRRSCAGPAG
jgi:hypothetical protein